MANARAQALITQNRQAMTGGFPGTAGPQPAGAQEQQSPLFDSWDVQRGLQPGWATQVYSAAIGLPRTFDTFRSGQFSALEPVFPVPIDRGEEPSGRPRPRRWQFPIGWNLPVGEPGTEGLKLANFQFLREIAEPVSVVRSCIEVVKNDILNLLDGLDPIIPTPLAQLAMQGNPTKRTDWEKRKAEVMEFLDNPDPDQYDCLEDWLNALIEDMVVLDASGIYLQPAGSGKNSKNGKGNGPLGSDIGALALLDGSGLRPIIDEWGGRPRPPEPYLQQYVWGVPRLDLMDMINLGPDATIADIQELNPVLEEITTEVDEWNGDQCIYFMANPRTKTPYGFGPVEQGMLIASMIWARQTWQWSFYSSSSLPSVFLDPGESIATAEEARQLQEAINMLGGDVAGMHQVIVLPPGAKPMEQKPVDLSDNFDTWSTALMCMPFGLTLDDLGAMPKVASIQSEGAAKQQQQASQDRTTRRSTIPRARKLKTKIFDRIIQGKFGQEDMEWTWGITEQGESRSEVVTEAVDLFHNTISTLDEARIALELDPFGIEGVSDVPMVFLPTGAIPLHASIELALNPPAPPEPAAVGAPGQKPPAALGPGKAPPSDVDNKKPIDASSTDSKPGNGNGKKPPPKNGKKPASGDNSEAAQSKPTMGAEEGADAVAAAPPDKHVSSEQKIAEMAQLRRYLRRGGHLGEFVPKALSPHVLAVGRRAKDVEGIIAAIAKAAGHVEARIVGINLQRVAIVEGVGKEADKLSNGQTQPEDFVVATVDLLRDQLKAAYEAGAGQATSELGADVVTALTDDATDAAIAERIDSLQPLLESFGSDIANGDVSDAAIANRASMWADQAQPAFEEGYVDSGAASGTPIIWHLGDTSQPCDLCLNRDGEKFTVDEIDGIGFPGDGDFGGDTCLGGPRCGCWLEFVKDGETLAETGAPSAARDNSMSDTSQEDYFNAYNDLASTDGTPVTAAAVADAIKASAIACPECGSTDLIMIPPDFESVRCDNCRTVFANKDFSLSGGAGGQGAPLASGFVPFDLSGPPPPKKKKKRKKAERFVDAAAAKRAFRFYPAAHYELDGDTIYVKAAEPQSAPEAAQASPGGLVAAGLALRSETTGRVLLQQRSLSDDDDRPDVAAGTWEWPGGGVEEGETPWAAAVREFTEETGCAMPAMARVVGTYISPNGIYQTFVVSVSSEAAVDPNRHFGDPSGVPMNPDDPDRDCPEVAAWFDIDHLSSMPALRPELAADLPHLLPVLRQGVSKVAEPDDGPPRLQGASIDEDEVFEYLQEHYPNADIGWVRRCLWVADNVLLSDVQWENRPGGVDEDKVDDMVEKLEDDWQPHPVVVIAPDADTDMEVADGYHRFAALDRAGIGAARAWVATPKPGNVGWRADVQAMQWSASNWTPPSQGKTLTKTLAHDVAAAVEVGDRLDDDETNERFLVKAVRGTEVFLERL
jgi:8-oxo-dGTP pyrophosphatase MutT (NUDIX family)